MVTRLTLNRRLKGKIHPFWLKCPFGCNHSCADRPRDVLFPNGHRFARRIEKRQAESEQEAKTAWASVRQGSRVPVPVALSSCFPPRAHFCIDDIKNTLLNTSACGRLPGVPNAVKGDVRLGDL